MIFYRQLPIVYPFTACYNGYIQDLGDNPRLTVNLYSENDNAVVNVDTAVDLKEVRQVSDTTIFIGTAYVNRDGNNLQPGNYRLLISVNGSYNIINLIYLPVEITNKRNSFQVSYMNRQNITDDELRTYLKDLVDPGVKFGFNVNYGQDTNSFDVSSGVALSRQGAKIVLTEDIRRAFTIKPTGEFPRTDAVCIKYNEELCDRFGKVCEPQIVVVEGDITSFGAIPVLHDDLLPIAYISVAANTGVLKPENTLISNLKRTSSGRPFFSIKARELGNGVRSEFTFDVEYIKDSTHVYVDGVEQFLGEDYKELSAGNGIGLIQFIGEVPAENQVVTLSGQVMNAVYINPHGLPFSSPVTPYAPSYAYDEGSTIISFKGYNYSTSDYKWVGDKGETMKAIPTLHPRRAFSQILGYHVYFRPTDRLVTSTGYSMNNVTYLFSTDVREMSQTAEVQRLLTTSHYKIDLIAGYDLFQIKLSDNNGSLYALNVQSGPVSVGPAVIAVSIFDNGITIRYNNIVKSWDSPLVLDDTTSLISLGCPQDNTAIGASIGLSIFAVLDHVPDNSEISMFMPVIE